MRTWPALLLGLFLGCSGPLVCTEIGCDDGLVVRFDRTPTGAFRVEAQGDGADPPAVFECADTSRCPPSAFFPGLVAERVTVRVTTPEGTVAQQFTPKYERQYPNGRSCGAACRQAHVTVRLPS